MTPQPHRLLPLLAAALLAAGPACTSRQGAARETTAYAAADPDARYRLAERIGVTLPTGRRHAAEVARTAEETTRGLMFRQVFAPDDAMIFVYEEPKKLGVWMKNVRFPIDVLFLEPTADATRLRVVHVLQGIPPCVTETCPTYPCPVPVPVFLELPAYTVSAEGLRVGDIVTLERAL